MNLRTAFSPLCVLLLFVCSTPKDAAADNWPQWRGPDGNSVSTEQNLPIAWNMRSGVKWKTPLPGEGASTPAIWEGAIFVTSHEGDKLLLLKLDRPSGRVAWTRQVGSGDARRKVEGEPKRGRQKFHNLHNLASPSPVTDGKTVVVHFGNGDLAAYDFAGEQLWRRNLQEDFGPYSIWWGHANSPVLVGELVISVCMQDSLVEPGEEPQAQSYLVAHDLRTGAQRWLTPRQTEADAEQCDAYTTPVLHQGANGLELIVMGGNQVDGYDPATGRQLWKLPNLVGGRTVTGPTVAHKRVYVTQGMRGPLLSIELGGEGTLDRDVIQWRDSQGTPDSCCPVVWEDLLFTVSDDGIARCFDALTGHLHWKQRIKGKFKASPLAAHGRIYFLNTDGLCTVISATNRFDRLTENPLDDTTLASPAVAAGNIYIRGENALYCIGR